MPTKLNEGVVGTAAAPAKGAMSIWDSEIRGFGLRVYSPTRRNPHGAKTFFVNYRSLGVERRLTIGEYPTWSAKAARAEEKALRKRIDLGEDPARERREAREAPTVKDLADRYKTEHLPRKALSSRKADWAMITGEILPVLGERKVSEVHFGDLKGLHERITASGRPVRANRVIAVASKMFALSLKPMAGGSEPWRDAAQGNPCKGIERNPEEGRERFFSTAEIAALSEALAEHQGPAANCLRWIMLTGCRPGEAMKAQWSEFAEPGVWTKPSGHTKQKKIHRVPLSPAAIELIGKLKSTRGTDDSEFVFPGRVAGKPLRELRRVWAAVTARAGLKGTLVYTLRHSYASIGAGGGLSLQIIGRLLGHTVTRTTERYEHLADNPLREAADRIGASIAGAGKDSGNVVQIEDRRA
jgi:integrase